jgi:hypothetical protein
MKLLTKLAFIFFLSQAISVSAQQVTSRFYPEKEEYLAGEPVFVVFEVVNNSSETVQFSENNCTQPFQIDNAPNKKKFSLFSDCGLGYGGSCAGNMRAIAPYSKYQKKFLLDGPFQLGQPGIYHVRAKLDRAISDKQTGDVIAANVESEFDVEFRLPQDGELRTAYTPILNDLQSRDFTARYLAAAGVIQNPPQFAEAAILAMAEDRGLANMSVEGLKKLASPATRTKLMEMAAINSPETQPAIEALGEIANPNDCNAILAVASQSVNYTQDEAYMAAGRICKEEADSLVLTGNPRLLRGLAVALGNRTPRSVVPVLFSLLRSSDAEIRRDVVNALTVLTHRTSKYGIDNENSAEQSYGEWLKWWRVNGNTTPFYNADECAMPQPLF